MLAVQITDTHIKPRGRLAYRRVDTAAALVRCIAHVNALDPRPDLALLTGDLVDMGRAEEYELLREILSDLAIPFYVIPGNHDDRLNMRVAFPDHAYLRQDPDFLHYAIETWPVRLIGLDTTIPGAKEGLLCERRLAWLDARLGEAPEKSTLVFMHHPPFLTGIEHMDAQNCGNADAFGAVLRRHRQVVRVLCGHVHRAVQVQWNGVPTSIGPSPSHAVALDLRPDPEAAFVVEPPACQLVHFRDDGSVVSHLSFIGAFDGPHPFFDPKGKLIE